MSVLFGLWLFLDKKAALCSNLPSKPLIFGKTYSKAQSVVWFSPNSSVLVGPVVSLVVTLMWHGHCRGGLRCLRTRTMVEGFLVSRRITWARLRSATFSPFTSRISSPADSRPEYSFSVLLSNMSSTYTPAVYSIILLKQYEYTVRV